MIIIKALKECPDYAPILAYWAYNEWYRDRDIEFDTVLKSYKSRANAETIPISLVAIMDNIPAGMASLKENDLWSRKDLNPWLASLYVTPEFRNKGIAGKLIDSVISRAIELYLKKIYLFAREDIENYYIKKGWAFVDSARGNDGENVKIFSYKL